MSYYYVVVVVVVIAAGGGGGGDAAPQSCRKRVCTVGSPPARPSPGGPGEASRPLGDAPVRGRGAGLSFGPRVSRAGEPAGRARRDVPPAPMAPRRAAISWRAVAASAQP